MSTRATYQIKSEWNGNPTFYIHYDGYKEGAALYFWNMIHAENKRGGWSTMFVRGNDLCEHTGGHDAHGDTEYQYTVDSKSKTVTVKHREWNCGWKGDWSGSMVEFINKFGPEGIEGFEPVNEVNGVIMTKSMLKARLEQRAKELADYKAKFPEAVGNISSMESDVKRLEKDVECFNVLNLKTVEA